MMIKAIFLFTLLTSASAYSQILGGTVVNEGRKLLTEPGFKVEGTVNGTAIYELAVNREGKVTSARLTETNIKSTPTKMAMRNFLMSFEFEGATRYPEFQHVQVKITAYKP